MTETTSSEEFNLADDYRAELEALLKKRLSLLRRQTVANHFSATAEALLKEIEDQIAILQDLTGEQDINDLLSKKPKTALKPRILFDRNDLNSIPFEEMTAEEQAEYRRREEEKKRLAERLELPAYLQQGNDLTVGSKEFRADKQQQKEQALQMPSQSRKEALRKKLSERDPRKLKSGLAELQKPENKDLLKDKDIEKLAKFADGRVTKFDKIYKSLRKNLRDLMRSGSDTIKSAIHDLKQGNIKSGFNTIKDVANTGEFGNEIVKSAKGVVNDVHEMFQLFDIKPEELLTKNLLEQAKPIFTNETTEKMESARVVDKKNPIESVLPAPQPEEQKVEDAKTVTEIVKEAVVEASEEDKKKIPLSMMSNQGRA